MNRRSVLPQRLVWRAFLVALGMLAGISVVIVWTWHRLDLRQDQEQEHRFTLNTQALSELLQARMDAYEMVLRGVSSVFTTDSDEVSPQVSRARWDEIMEQLQLQRVYPGISSIAWTRYLRADELDDFISNIRADGRPGYRVFPQGEREAYQLLEHIGPLNVRTRAVWGLDLLTRPFQSQTITQAMDSGQVTLSPPLSALYVVAPEASREDGMVMYLPLYRTTSLPVTREARRAALIGTLNLAFRGDELAEAVFGTRLRLFHIIAHDVDTGQPIFNTATKSAVPSSDWTPMLSRQVDVPLLGRTWRLSINSLPEYEQALLSRSQNLVLFMGLSTAVLVALLTGAFVWQRDRQLHESRVVQSKLRDQTEQLMLANRYKSEFLANMSHELRTPLNSILILSDQLRQNTRGNLTEQQARHASIVYRSGSDLLQLINDVLDLAKVETGRMQLSLEPLNLQDLLVDLDASMRPLAEAKHLHLYISPITPGSGVPPRVFTDHVRLHQILRNLLSNAIKFTDHGQVSVTIRAGETRKNDIRMIHFEVRDTGIGIAPAQHSQAFEAFQQLDGSTSRLHGGTGLGLAITRQIVQVLGGDIDVQSALGQGSTFTVRLPMQAVPAMPESNTQAPQRAGEGAPVLIVEDDANFADTIVEKAHAHGFSSVHCVTGQQAMGVLKNETFAAVVLDILLPDISGWQLFSRLRAMPEHRHTPVHIISCLPQPTGLDEQGTHYLVKPLERDALEHLFVNLKDETRANRPPTLLLVEDVEAEREHYRKQLTELGFDVTTCERAHEAHLLWLGGKFDVLVMDLNLPDQDGFSLLASLNSARLLQGTRVIVNTGLDVSQEGLQRLYAYSAVVVHKKGDDTAVLEQAVQGFLGGIRNAANDPALTPRAAQGEGGTPAAAQHATPATAPAPSIRSCLHGQHVLLVDDDIRNVYAMSALLGELGLTISTATNGEQAIVQFLQDAPDLILMDMSMPVMDGYEATHVLKTEHKCTIPIIALTAHAMKGDREKCLAAGADDYMAKPVDGEVLRATLERWLNAQAS